MGLFALVLAGIVVVVLLWFIGLYNSIVASENRVDNAWSQIDVQLKKRHDLIPNLVETVKGYATHERETLERVIQARNMAVQAGGGVAAQAQQENLLTGALKSIFALSEAYPDLKANANFQQLQADLTGIENKIAYARQAYNDAVLHFNNMIEQFPGVIVAGLMGKSEKEYFEVAVEAEREVPKVSFS